MKQQRGLADDTSRVKATVLTVKRNSSGASLMAEGSGVQVCSTSHPMAAVHEDAVSVMCEKSEQLDL